MLELSAHLKEHLPKEDTFDWLLNVKGRVHREVKHRRTVDFEIGGRHYFIKIHQGCGWGEIFKDWFQLRAPVVSARTEWEAIERLRQIGIPTLALAGKGERGANPARRESFVTTEAMEEMISLEDLTRHWGGLTGGKRKLLKLKLLEKIALMARTLHQNGLNHRDFYLCHFLVKDRRWTDWQPVEPLELVLIDLHRVQQRKCVPRRWVIKDLGGLLYSALECGLTSGDVLRFISLYRQRPWREILGEEKSFWQQVWRNARQLNTSSYYKPVKPPAILAGVS